MLPGAGVALVADRRRSELFRFLRAVLAQCLERIGHLEDVELKLVRRVAGRVIEGVRHALDAVLDETLGAAVDLLVKVVGVERSPGGGLPICPRSIPAASPTAAACAASLRWGSGTAASSASISAGLSPLPVAAAAAGQRDAAADRPSPAPPRVAAVAARLLAAIARRSTGGAV